MGFRKLLLFAWVFCFGLLFIAPAAPAQEAGNVDFGAGNVQFGASAVGSGG